MKRSTSSIHALIAVLIVLAMAPACASAASGGQAIVNAAASQAGRTYCWAGGTTSGASHGSGLGPYVSGEGYEAPDCGQSTTTGFDCTGLVIYAVYQGTGGAVNLSAYHGPTQAAHAPGTWIASESDLQPGDIVYFGSSRSNITHAAIYAGGGMVWDANTAFWKYPDGVYQRSLSSENSLGFVGAARVWASTSTGGGTGASAPPPVDSSPGTVVNQSTGLTSVFVEGPSHSLDDYFVYPGSPWTGPVQVAGPGTTFSAPAAVLNQATGQISLFAQGANNTLDNYWVTAGQPWSGPAIPGGAGSTFS
jgi:cell wall-associated NlpC family hydrolase